MVAKIVWTALIVVGVLSVSGLGFAAWTTTATINGTGSAGNINLDFANVNTNLLTNTPSYTTCTSAVGTPPNTATVTATNFDAESMCVIYANLTNTGSLPITSLTVSISVTSNVTGCWDAQTIQSPSTSVGPGSTTTTGWIGFFELEENSQAHNNCELSTGTLTVTFTGTLANSNSLSDSP
jgi:hypothetical protein